MPNWFWYHRQADNTGSGNNGLGNGSVVYGGASDPKYGETNYQTITIYDSAGRPALRPVFAIYTFPNGRKLVQKAGDLELKGLYSYMQVIGHELGHIANHAANIEISGGPLAGDKDPDRNGVLTGDDAKDDWETRNNFDPIS